MYQAAVPTRKVSIIRKAVGRYEREGPHWLKYSHQTMNLHELLYKVLSITLTCNLGSAKANSKASALAGEEATLTRGGGRDVREGGASLAGLFPPVEEPLRASAFSSSKGLVS